MINRHCLSWHLPITPGLPQSS